MNGKDIIWGLTYVSDSIVEEAEYGALPARTERILQNEKKGSIFRRSMLVAAIIALLLLLVGCAFVYVLSLQDFEIGSQTTTKEVWSDDGMELLDEETVPQQVFNMSGLKGTASYQASKEWFEFLQSYDPDKQIKLSIGDNCPEYPEEYDAYYPYSQEMVKKIDEIANKYDLDLLGEGAGLDLFMQDMTPAFQTACFVRKVMPESKPFPNAGSMKVAVWDSISIWSCQRERISGLIRCIIVCTL